MKYQIAYEANPKQEGVQVLGDGIMEYTKLKKNQLPIEHFAYFIRDEAGRILGGCNGSIYYGCFYIDQLWLDENLRGKGIGKHLMQTAELLAIEKKCQFMAVNTMDWEALNFYQKLGFEIEFIRTGYANNSTFYFLRKELI